MMRGKREGNWFSVDKSASEDDSNEEEQEDEESEEETEESEEEQEKHNIYVIALDNKLDYQRVTSNNMDPSTYTKIPGVLPQDVPEPILLNFKKGRLAEERRVALAGAFRSPHPSVEAHRQGREQRRNRVRVRRAARETLDNPAQRQPRRHHNPRRQPPPLGKQRQLRR